MNELVMQLEEVPVDRTLCTVTQWSHDLGDKTLAGDITFGRPVDRLSMFIGELLGRVPSNSSVSRITVRVQFENDPEPTYTPNYFATTSTTTSSSTSPGGLKMPALTSYDTTNREDLALKPKKKPKKTSKPKPKKATPSKKPKY